MGAALAVRFDESSPPLLRRTGKSVVRRDLRNFKTGSTGDYRCRPDGVAPAVPGLESAGDDVNELNV